MCTLAAGRLLRIWPDRAVPVREVWSREVAMVIKILSLNVVFGLHDVVQLLTVNKKPTCGRNSSAQIGLEIRPDLVTGSPAQRYLACSVQPGD